MLPTATRLFVPANQNLPFTRFQQPQPRPNSGTHRFIYALYTQPARYNNAGFESAGMEAKLENWEVGGPVTPRTASIVAKLRLTLRSSQDGECSSASGRPLERPSS